MSPRRAVRRGQGAAGARTSWSRRSPSAARCRWSCSPPGGIATPADAAMMMQLGADGVFVGSGIFKSGNPAERANAIVQATLHYNDPGVDRQGLPRPGRGDGRDQRRGDPGAAPPRRARVVTGPRIGVLALQGDVREHLRGPRAESARRAVRVNDADALATVDGLVLPGGESTTISMLAVRWGLMEPLRAAAAGRAAHVRVVRRDDPAGRHDPRRPRRPAPIGGIDMVVRRNAFGRQVDSFEADVEFAGPRRRADPRGLHPGAWVESVGADSVAGSRPAVRGRPPRSRGIGSWPFERVAAGHLVPP